MSETNIHDCGRTKEHWATIHNIYNTFDYYRKYQALSQLEEWVKSEKKIILKQIEKRI